MAIVRELVTKLGFQIDKTNLRAFDQQIGTMSKSLVAMTTNINRAAIGMQSLGTGKSKPKALDQQIGTMSRSLNTMTSRANREIIGRNWEDTSVIKPKGLDQQLGTMSRKLDTVSTSANRATARINDFGAGAVVNKSKLRAFDQQLGIMSRSIGAMTGNINRLAGGMQNLGLKMSLLISTPLVLVNLWAIKAASKVEQLDVSFTTMLGSTEKAKRLMTDMFELAANTPFEIKNIGPSIKLLLAMGISQKKMIPTLRTLGNAAAGLSIPIQRLALNYGQVRTQGKLTGRDLKDFNVAGVPMVDELAKSLGKQKKEIAGMVSAGRISFAMVEQVFQNMSKEGGRFYNLMIKQSKTLNGLWSTLKDNLFLTGVVFGEIIIKSLHLKKGISKLTKGIKKLAKGFEKLSPFMQKMIVSLSGFLIILGPLLLVLGTLIKIIVFLKTTLLVLKIAFFGAAKGAGALNASVLLIPMLILAAIAAFALFVEDIAVWVKGGDSLTGKLLRPWKDFKTGLKKIFSSIKDMFLKFLDGPMTKFIDKIMNAFRWMDKAFKFGVDYLDLNYLTPEQKQAKSQKQKQTDKKPGYIKRVFDEFLGIGDLTSKDAEQKLKSMNFDFSSLKQQNGISAIGDQRAKDIKKTSSILQAPIQIKNENKITFNDSSSITEDNALKVADTFTQKFSNGLSDVISTEILSNPALEQ